MDKLKKQRGLTKGKITRVKTYRDQNVADFAATGQELSGRIQYLDNTWIEYREIHRQIFDICPSDQDADEETEFEEMEQKYLETDAGLKTLLSTLQVSSDTASLTPSSNTPSSASGASGVPTIGQVKLPRMELPSFSGNHMEWQSFRDLFKSIIHQNTKISDSQKLHYLKNSVKDEAHELLESIDITDANYKIAWDLLAERYENERQIILSHLTGFLSQPVMSNESASQLRSLLDTTYKHIRALKSLGLATDQWDPVVICILINRLDQESRKQWELHSPGKSFPTLIELKTFLDQRCRALEANNLSKAKTTQKPAYSTTHHQNHRSGLKTHHVGAKPSCPVCNSNHYISSCNQFSNLSEKEKNEMVKKLRLCFNCLRTNHSIKQCKSESRCRHCKGKHHTLLHSNHPNQNSIQSSQNSSQYSKQETESKLTTVVTGHIDKPGAQVLLSTVMVKVKGGDGSTQQCRALLDSGSQASLITEACVQRLRLPRARANVSISGIGQSGTGNSHGKVNLVLNSNISNFSIKIEALVMPCLTSSLPNSRINIEQWSYLKTIQLADETFGNPGPIDILIGADYYEDIVRDGKIHGPVGAPAARHTEFGWVLSGKIDTPILNITIGHVSTIDISNQLKQFWELEEVDHIQHLTPDEKECETHFNSHVSRDTTGRFTVSIPFKQNRKLIGRSKDICIKRLQSVERRLERCPEYQQQYDEFMTQYLHLGHMELIPTDQTEEVISKTNYLPHHFVLKESSSTTSFRVVFDASAQTSTGVSLNETMMIGPKIQDNIIDILIRFRLHKYAFTADIAKMYRQVNVTTEDANLQRIVWRSNPSEPIKEYRLTTVTYGTASAPYLAVKTTQQLADIEGDKFPLAKQVVYRDFYVDDVMTGDNSLDTALQVQKQLINMLQLGGFQLRKFYANHEALLDSVPPDYRESSLQIGSNPEDSIKALGTFWNAARDYFFFKVSLPPISKTITKRSILSETARLFDPLGYLAPVTIVSKIIFQKLWISGVSWDEQVHEDTKQEWSNFRSQLFKLEDIRIPRFVGGESTSTYQIHGFSDASERAYSAVIYIRTANENGKIQVHLLTSKTKVAPIKQLSIPRLELCGATLLAKLIKKIQNIFHVHIQSITAWTDSTITLNWISGYPIKWTTFVANRVAEIQTFTSPSNWRHVPSGDNPADCASRGMSSHEFLEFPLWWNGPEWLLKEEKFWPVSPGLSEYESLPEKKRTKLIVNQGTVEWNLIHKFSSFTRLIRVTAYCKRFLCNFKKRKADQIKTPLTTTELKHALVFWVKQVQQNEFAKTIECLNKRKPIKEHLALNPFLDNDGVLRVGGRLRKSNLKFDTKHPILIPKKHHLTYLIMAHDHAKHLHCGAQLLLAAIRQQFWIIGGRNAVRDFIHKCVTCIRDRGNTLQQQMGDLPTHRIEKSRPFIKTGVDYCGPILLKTIRGRGGKIFKGYIALFICFCTKAIHLELVTDLTSEAFLATLKRFIGRRGKPSDLFSDNGTNFVGANSEMKELNELLRSQTTTLTDELVNEGINWHFNPPNAPHFGGLWEAGIKSVKKHLRRVIGDQVLTYEEMYTTLTQIEACLNSRPLCPLTTDPNDATALTPGHFLIGEPLTSIPEPDLTHLRTNRMSRWQLVQQMSQHFWKRWQVEYLTELQLRTKWTKSQANVKIGDLVLIKQDNTHSQRWPMGRIIEIHSGKDNLIRAATLKTANGIIQRPIVKLCLLPIEAFDPVIP